MSTHDELKQQMIVAGKVLVAEGQDDFTRGHISFRLPDNPNLFFMKAHSLGLDEITMDNILTVDLEGDVVAGTSRRHSEVYIHSEIYRVRPDVHCILHTHPTYSVALSATGRRMKAYCIPAALFYNSLGVYLDTINLIRTKELGCGVAKALGLHRAVLLKNHGVVVTGRSVPEVVISAVMLEDAAKVQMMVEMAGEPAGEFSPDEIRRLQHDVSRPDQFVVNYDYLVRRMKRRGIC